MKGNGDIFVKMNYKNIGELNSFIYNSMNGKNKNEDSSCGDRRRRDDKNHLGHDQGRAHLTFC